MLPHWWPTGPDVRFYLRNLLCFLRWAMAASNRRGSSLPKPHIALQFVCSNPRTPMVKWS